MLSKEDLQAMRQADSLVVWIEPSKTDPDRYSARLRVSKRLPAKKRGLFAAEARELNYFLPVFPARIVLSTYFERGRNHLGLKAFGSVMLAASCGAWQALVRLCRVGDELVFTAQENGNQYVREAIGAGDGETGHWRGLYHDELSVELHRQNKTIIQELMLVDSVCPNNSARMIQGA